MSEQQPIKYLDNPTVCKVHRFCSWVRLCPHCNSSGSLRDDLLWALLHEHNFDGLYARCMELVDRYKEAK